jgi:aspartate/methionine/tyrosine aminotransferase
MSDAASTPVSRRAREITPFLVMDILERAKELERQGEHIIHLEIGEPDFPTPEVVKDAAYRAMAAGETQYTHSQGFIELRETLCRHYLEKYGVGCRRSSSSSPRAPPRPWSSSLRPFWTRGTKRC